ncbi:MAG TPA: hypothetical protein VF550_06745, partial [Polyangia bacterium]
PCISSSHEYACLIASGSTGAEPATVVRYSHDPCVHQGIASHVPRQGQRQARQFAHAGQRSMNPWLMPDQLTP